MEILVIAIVEVLHGNLEWGRKFFQTGLLKWVCADGFVELAILSISAINGLEKN